MIAFLDGSGFFTAKSSTGADISLLIAVLAAVVLTIGVILAKTRHFEAHRWLQTAAVCLNAVPVVAWMIRSFWLYVLPGLPGNLGTKADALTTVHALTGLVGVTLGVFVVVRANQLEAQGQSLSRYKLPMRIAYLVYMLATALGVWLYFVIYG